MNEIVLFSIVCFFRRSNNFDFTLFIDFDRKGAARVHFHINFDHCLRKSEISRSECTFPFVTLTKSIGFDGSLQL